MELEQHIRGIYSSIITRLTRILLEFLVALFFIFLIASW